MSQSQFAVGTDIVKVFGGVLVGELFRVFIVDFDEGDERVLHHTIEHDDNAYCLLIMNNLD